jgi:hypothetical protein
MTAFLKTGIKRKVVSTNSGAANGIRLEWRTETVLKVLKSVAEIYLGRWARRGRGARARRALVPVPNAGHYPK